MNFQSSWTFDELDAYVERQLKASVAKAAPPVSLRQRMLRAARWASLVGGGEDQAGTEMGGGERSEEHLELHHRLIGNGLFYHAPLGTQAGFMIS